MPLIVNGTKIKHLKVIQNGVTKEMKVGKFSDGTIFFKGKPIIDVEYWDAYNLTYYREYFSEAQLRIRVIDLGCCDNLKIKVNGIMYHEHSSGSNSAERIEKEHIFTTNNESKTFRLTSETRFEYDNCHFEDITISDNNTNEVYYTLSFSRDLYDVPFVKGYDCLILWKTFHFE